MAGKTLTVMICVSVFVMLVYLGALVARELDGVFERLDAITP